MLTIQFIFRKRKHHRAFPNRLTAMMFWKWCSRRESNPKCKLRRFELYPFNYENKFLVFFKNYTDFYTDFQKIFKNGAILMVFRLKTARLDGSTKPLGGVCYIHLTIQAYSFFAFIRNTYISYNLTFLLYTLF